MQPSNTCRGLQNNRTRPFVTGSALIGIIGKNRLSNTQTLLQVLYRNRIPQSLKNNDCWEFNYMAFTHLDFRNWLTTSRNGKNDMRTTRQICSKLFHNTYCFNIWPFIWLHYILLFCYHHSFQSTVKVCSLFCFFSI